MINDPANWLALLKQYSSSAENLAVQKAIIGHMRDEIATQRLAGTDSTLSFRLDGIEMIVNDRKQPEEVYQRFKERYIKVPGYYL